MAQTKTVHTLERARNAFADIKQAIENKTGNALNEVPVEDYDGIINNMPSTPALETIVVTPDVVSQTITPEQGVDGYNVISVDAVSSSIDQNIKPENIKNGVEILGITGSYEGGTANLQTKDVQPYFDQGNMVVEPDSGYDGMSKVTIIKDNNLVSENIKQGVELFGIYGNYIGGIDVDVKDTPIELNVVSYSGAVGNVLARALFEINGTIYLIWNDNIYMYNLHTEMWEVYDTNEDFLGPHMSVGANRNPIADDAVVIGTKIVWLYTTDKLHVRWYDIPTKTMGTDIEVELQTPTAYSMQILCFDVVVGYSENNTYNDIYFYEVQNNAIYKLRVDVDKGTANLNNYYSNATNNLGIYKIKSYGNEVYALANEGLYLISSGKAVQKVEFTDTTSKYRDFIKVYGYGLIFSGGLNDSHSLYLYNPLTEESGKIHESTNGVFMDSSTLYKDGRVYRYIYRTGKNSWDYDNKCQIIIDDIPVFTINSDYRPAIYTVNRYINSIVLS